MKTDLYRFAALALVLVPMNACSSSPSNAPGTRYIGLPAGADRHLKTKSEITADEIDVVLPAIYRGACSVTCAPDVQTRRITTREIELTDPAGLGIPPLALQVAELRLQARQKIHASFDDDTVRKTGVLLKLNAKGGVHYVGADGVRDGQKLTIRNDELKLTD